MEWFKKHADSIASLGAILGIFIWLWAQFGNINDKFDAMNARFANLEKDIAVIKAVMIMKNILPSELAKDKEK